MFAVFPEMQCNLGLPPCNFALITQVWQSSMRKKTYKDNRQKQVSYMDRDKIYAVAKSKCETCMNYLEDKECPVFWGKIPNDIWSGRTGHNKVRKGQFLGFIYEKSGGLR